MSKEIQPPQPSSDEIMDPAIEATDRIIEMVREGSQARLEQSTQAPETTFQEPARARAKLEAAEKEYRAEYDRLDNMGIYSGVQIEQQLARKGIKRLATAEEVEVAEAERLAEQRTNPNNTPAKPRTQSKPSQRTPAQNPRTRMSAAYDNSPDPESF